MGLLVAFPVPGPSLPARRIRFAASGMCHSDEHMRTGDSIGRLPKRDKALESGATHVFGSAAETQQRSPR